MERNQPVRKVALGLITLAVLALVVSLPVWAGGPGEGGNGAGGPEVTPASHRNFDARTETNRGLDHRPGQAAFLHVGERRSVEDIVLIAGAQDLQEVPPALGEGGGEEGGRRSRRGMRSVQRFHSGLATESTTGFEKGDLSWPPKP